MDKLESDGFVIFKNAIIMEENAQARSCIDGQTMDYTKMKTFIEEIMLSKLSAQLDAPNIL